MIILLADLSFYWWRSDPHLGADSTIKIFHIQDYKKKEWVDERRSMGV